jgi:hypothetical protein
MKLCVGNLACTDLTPRPADVVVSTFDAPRSETFRRRTDLPQPLGARMREVLASLFDEEDELPTRLYVAARG